LVGRQGAEHFCHAKPKFATGLVGRGHFQHFVVELLIVVFDQQSDIGKQFLFVTAQMA